MVVQKQITLTRAGLILGVTPKQVRRMAERYRLAGPEGLEHGLKGRPSNHRVSDDLVAHAVELMRMEHKFGGMGPTLTSEFLAEYHGVHLSHETVRAIMAKEGLLAPTERKVEYHPLRPRRDHFGELIQMDTSEHAWFGEEYPICQLTAMIDDATQTLYARFYGTDSTETNMDCIMRYIGLYGLPRALYTDRASHFKHNPPEERGKKPGKPCKEGPTQIARALKDCGIRHILALSPQAKGRIERSFGTMQDRLFHRLRFEGITDMDAANEFLDSKYLDMWKKRFGREPKAAGDLHMPVGDLNLNAIFSIHAQRTVANNYTVRLNRRKFQIEEHGNKLNGLKHSKVRVETRLNGEIKLNYKGKYLHMHEIFTE